MSVTHKSTPQTQENQTPRSVKEKAELRRLQEAELRRYDEERARPDDLDAGLSAVTRQAIAGEFKGDAPKAALTLAILELTIEAREAGAESAGDLIRFILCFGAASAGIPSGWLADAVAAVTKWHERESKAGRSTDARMIPAALDHLWRGVKPKTKMQDLHAHLVETWNADK